MRIKKVTQVAGVVNGTVDYIIEEGTSGIWTYRKWNSGISECWGNKTGTVNVNNQWGSSYFYYGTITSENFPTNLFINVPTISFQNIVGSTLISGNGSDASSTSTGQIQVMRTTSVSNANYNICIRAIGKWK